MNHKQSMALISEYHLVIKKIIFVHVRKELTCIDQDDIYQEVVIQLLKRLPKFDKNLNSSIRAFISSVTYYTLQDTIRKYEMIKRKRDKEQDHVYYKNLFSREVKISTIASWDEADEVTETQKQVLLLLDTLSRRQKELCYDYYLQNLDLGQIAEKYKISRNHASTVLGQARQNLRKFFNHDLSQAKKFLKMES